MFLSEHAYLYKNKCICWRNNQEKQNLFSSFFSSLSHFGNDLVKLNKLKAKLREIKKRNENLLLQKKKKNSSILLLFSHVFLFQNKLDKYVST